MAKAMKAEANPASAKAHKSSTTGWEVSAAVKVSFVSARSSERIFGSLSDG
jgi:hypothetical protein